MLQAMFRNRKAVLYFIYGSLAKIVLQLPSIAIFHSYGLLIFNDHRSHHPNCFNVPWNSSDYRCSPKDYLEENNLSHYLTLVMFILVGFLQWIFGLVFHPIGRFWSFICRLNWYDWWWALWGRESILTLDKVVGQAKGPVTSALKVIIIFTAKRTIWTYVKGLNCSFSWKIQKYKM